jgi:MutS domain V
MDIKHTLQECRIDSVLESIGIKSISAKNLFTEQSKKWTTNLRILNARSNAWRSLKIADPDWMSHLPFLLENESIIRKLDPATASESQTEDWSQILFTGEWSSFNFIPFVLMYVALSKIFLAPLIAWTMPFMTIIMPFLALKFVYGLPITWNMYWAQMSPMIFGRANQEMNIGTLLQYGSMIFSYAHGMYLPYTNAKHCYKIDQLMIKGSKAIIDTIKRLHEISDKWISYGLRKPWTLPNPSELGDERQILAWLMEDKQLLPQIYRAIGQVEIATAIANSKTLVPVEWSDSSIPLCNMSDAIDPLLDEKNRVPFTLTMSQKEHHAICTGPNRGGKSTFLRSVLINLVLSHTWGVSFASKCLLTPVEWVISSLRLEDRPGQESLFEREVSVAGDIVKHIREKKSRGWVIIDELFHTTNPPDAAVASQIFLLQLWSSEFTSSIVSTHLFSHAETAPTNVQRLCVDSTLGKEGKIDYSYKVKRGMNTMSSVKELLVESKVLVV